MSEENSSLVCEENEEDKEISEEDKALKHLAEILVESYLEQKKYGNNKNKNSN